MKDFPLNGAANSQENGQMPEPSNLELVRRNLINLRAELGAGLIDDEAIILKMEDALKKLEAHAGKTSLDAIAPRVSEPFAP